MLKLLLLFGVLLVQFQPSGSDGWDGHLGLWGTMREVLAKGQTGGRIRLDALQHRKQIIGVGALENLEGEITIWDGHVWVTKGTARAVEARQESAALLMTARVSEWSSTVSRTEVSADQLEQVLRIAGAGWNNTRFFPFVIEGKLTVDAHVVGGKCPHSGEKAADAPPVTFSFKDEPATLVGFFAWDSEGVLTHHGTKIHAHVITRETTPRTGHVDKVSVGPGATIRVPSRL